MMNTTTTRQSEGNQVVMEIEAISKTASAAAAEAGAGAGKGVVPVPLSPLSETLWKENINSSRGGGGGGLTLGDVSARLTWKDLTVMVTLSNGETQNVLEHLTGYAEPGSFTALMGPSGSGKSTLLDALSSRLAANAFLSGTILLNGRKTKLSFGTAVSITSILFSSSSVDCGYLHLKVFLLKFR